MLTTQTKAMRRAGNLPRTFMAAHAGCFTMSLAREVMEAGYQARRIKTDLTVRMEKRRRRWAVTEILIETTANVGRMTAIKFVDAAMQAKRECSIKGLSPTRIWMNARMDKTQFEATAAKASGHENRFKK